ncbi:MAG: zinc ribbon domain-containing protein, partial [Anaerovoracaceae bacterium]
SRSVIDKILSNGKYVPYAVPMELFVATQFEKDSRTNTQMNSDGSTQRKTTPYSSQNILSGLLICAECGANYRRITRPSGELVWRCGNRVEHGKKICKHTPSISEVQLKQSICQMLDMDELNPQEIKDQLESIQVKADGTLEPEMMQSEYQMFYSNHA